MTSFFKAVSVAAGVCAAAASFAGIASTAQAEEFHIRTADLDLNTAQGQARFNARVEFAAQHMCNSFDSLQRQRACVMGIREEAQQDLSRQRQELARRNGTAVAWRR